MSRKLGRFYIIYGVFTVEEVLRSRCRVGEKRRRPFTTQDGNTYHVKMSSLRYLVFSKGTVCVECGLVGTVMRLEVCPVKEGDILPQPHFNLYGLNSEGQWILFTKDHIRPRSKGGKDNINNMQTMCSICNKKKGNTFEE